MDEATAAERFERLNAADARAAGPAGLDVGVHELGRVADLVADRGRFPSACGVRDYGHEHLLIYGRTAARPTHPADCPQFREFARLLGLGGSHRGCEVLGGGDAPPRLCAASPDRDGTVWVAAVRVPAGAGGPRVLETAAFVRGLLSRVYAGVC